MSKKKDSSESGSLELLLDTMCNTFGGVMFIAISLVVIASFIPKFIKESTTEEMTLEQLEKIEDEIDGLKKKIEALSQSRSIDEKILEKYRSNPNLPLIVEYAKLKEGNLALGDKEMQFRISQQALALRLKLAKAENDRKQEDLKKITDQIVELTKKMSEEEKTLIIEIEIVKREIAACKNKEKIVYSKLEKTSKIPYFMIVGKNDIFPISDKQNIALVETEENSGKRTFHISENVSYAFIENQGKIIFTPKNGISRGDVSDLIFEAMLRGISKDERFLWAMVRDDSFPLFIKFRDFAREKGFKIYWYPVVDDSEYCLSIVKKAGYEDQ